MLLRKGNFGFSKLTIVIEKEHQNIVCNGQIQHRIMSSRNFYVEKNLKSKDVKRLQKYSNFKLNEFQIICTQFQNLRTYIIIVDEKLRR